MARNASSSLTFDSGYSYLAYVLSMTCMVCGFTEKKNIFIEMTVMSKVKATTT